MISVISCQAARYSLYALLSALAMLQPIIACAITPEEYDKQREKMAKRYEGFNATIEAQALQWNSLMAIESAGTGFRIAEKKLIDCLTQRTTLRSQDESCAQSRDTYLRYMRRVKAIVEANITPKHKADAKSKTAELAVALDKEIAQLERGRQFLPLRVTSKLCARKQPRFASTFDRYSTQLESGQMKQAVLIAHEARKVYNYSAVLDSICSSVPAYNSEANTKWRRSLADQMTLITFVETKLHPRFSGAQVCLTFHAKRPQLRKSRQARSFSEVCTLLVSADELSTHSAGQQWVTAALRTMKDAKCRENVVRDFSPILHQLEKLRYSAASLQVPSCAMPPSPWVSVHPANVVPIRRLMLSAVALQ